LPETAKRDYNPDPRELESDKMSELPALTLLEATISKASKGRYAILIGPSVNVSRFLGKSE
jgi:hypothetical protein